MHHGMFSWRDSAILTGLKKVVVLWSPTSLFSAVTVSNTTVSPHNHHFPIHHQTMTNKYITAYWITVQCTNTPMLPKWWHDVQAQCVGNVSQYQICHNRSIFIENLSHLCLCPKQLDYLTRLLHLFLLRSFHWCIFNRHWHYLFKFFFLPSKAICWTYLPSNECWNGAQTTWRSIVCYQLITSTQ